ncbi:MAG: phosphoribosylaminoimidazolesuccinocarboxamide synthase [Catalinimonas sp.]
MQAIKETHFNFPGQTDFYRGKVRDVYHFDDKIAVVVTDRISAFDVVLPRAIPHKGQVLNQIAARFLHATDDVVPNWVIHVPDPNVTIGLACAPVPVEMVVRGYLVGHAWREYRAGRRTLCGVPLPEGMRENDAFPAPIITPTTKAHAGHDEDISREEIIARGLAPAERFDRMAEYALALFARGTEIARQQGLILVDTKYEFGTRGGNLYLIDEVHTPDSSRYFYADGYDERQARGEAQRQLSKEFVRRWLIEGGFQGKDGQQVPEMDDARVREISDRYVELFEQVTGGTFDRRTDTNPLGRIEANIRKYL